MQKKNIAICSVLLSFVALGALGQMAFAQTYGQAATNSPTLEEELKLARSRIADVQANPHAGSGTPFLAADGMITAMGLSAGIMGAIFVVFAYMGKKAEQARKTQALK